MIHHQTHTRPTESYFLTDVSESAVNWQIRRHEDCPELKYCGHFNVEVLRGTTKNPVKIITSIKTGI